VASLLVRTRAAREAWERDGNVEADFEELRAEVVRIAGLLPAEDEKAQKLVRVSAELGVRSSSPS
jgi:hypothetical protein